MKTLVINLIIVLAAGIGFQASVPETKIIPEKLPNNSYKAGEYLKYKVYYGWVNGGTATLTLTEKTVSGKTIHYGRAYAKTIGTADQLFSVRDIYESYMDPETGLSLKSIRNVREGNYKKYNEVLYNHSNNTIKSLLSGTKEVPDNIRDLVGAFYYFRRYDLNSMKVGEKIKLETYFEDKVYPLELKFKGIESVKTKIGTFKCMKMVPIVETGGVFDDAEGDLTFYISADKNKIPIRVQVDFLVGSFKCDLIVYSGLKHELAKEDILK
ncbi:MAG: hypothetical protein A2W91_14695 [Bacteroidetes bacterium GWF2_38_335]|nr:MAG: hypothetical protein A2W91_14695 [Bacteroidetes bacterium GWF2_38_335]OFY78451.1 MAG: hypothetical protein A2281_16005 [Bacteroidetes bacterium RIFOXYA12_FULL_38_20]HBS88396.1 DUF3108 domain-containing protein [Bacteroidales bacterium]